MGLLPSLLVRRCDLVRLARRGSGKTTSRRPTLALAHVGGTMAARASASSRGSGRLYFPWRQRAGGATRKRAKRERRQRHWALSGPVRRSRGLAMR